MLFAIGLGPGWSRDYVGVMGLLLGSYKIGIR